MPVVKVSVYMSVPDGPHKNLVLCVMNKTDINKLNYHQGAVFLETLIVAKLIKGFHHLMEPEGFLSCSQDCQ
jgi:hypothetical protein